MRFEEIFRRAGVEPERTEGDAKVTGLVMDTRKLLSGGCFVCMPGTTTDSHSYLEDAAANGAVAAIVHGPEGFEKARSLGLAAAKLPGDKMGFADAIWRVCDAFFDHPTRNMKVIGVTGTNGKTTTAWLIRDMLRALGVRAAYLGTLGIQLPDEERELSNTTPFAVELYNLLAEARDKGVEALAMEVSSHALKEKRVDGVEFDVAVFTNLTQDHLDYHGTMEDYERSKWRLFSELPRQSKKRFVAVINVDDPIGAAWLTRSGFRPWQSPRCPPVFTNESANRTESITTTPELLQYGKNGADLAADVVKVAVDQIHLELRHLGEEPPLRSTLGGDYNVENLLGAAAAGLALGYGVEEVAVALSVARPVPGRFEAVPSNAGISILVDYAHTPDAIEKLLDAVRPLTQGRIITVFGCGGDRDKTKRPKMARAASERSDIAVVTSDNPRTENPQSILNDVVAGIVPGRESVAIIDRGEAIAHAVQIAQPGDVVVIAGKGHENYQIIGRTKYPMDDRKLARKGLELRGTEANAPD